MYTDNSYNKKLLFVTGFGGAGNSSTDKAIIKNSNTEHLINTKSTGDGFLISTPTAYRLYYNIDNVGGDSGGPVYANVKGKQTVIGVHTRGTSKEEPYNKGMRFTTDILNLIYHHK